MEKKTNRNNQKSLQVNWPDNDSFWTVKDLCKMNPQFKAEITLRVRLSNAIKRDKLVAVIGDKMNSHGRPEMVCAMIQKDGTVKNAVIESAKKAGIRCNETASVVITNIKSTSQPSRIDNKLSSNPLQVEPLEVEEKESVV